MKTILSIAVALTLLTGLSVLAVQNSFAETKTINADKVVIKKGEDITINVNGIPGKQGPRGFNGSDSTVPGPQGPPGANSTVPGPAGKDGTTLSNETVAAVNQVVNQSAVLNQLYQAFLNGSLSSVSVTATNNTNGTG